MLLACCRSCAAFLLLVLGLCVATEGIAPDEAFACRAVEPPPAAIQSAAGAGSFDAGSLLPPPYIPGSYRQCPDEDFGYWYQYEFTPWLEQLPTAIKDALPPPCPSGQVGTPPNCITTSPPPPCPSGQYGIPPNCVTPPQPCPVGQVGTVQPDCEDPMDPDWDLGTPGLPETDFDDLLGETTGVEDSPHGAVVVAYDGGTLNLAAQDMLVWGTNNPELAERIRDGAITLPELAAAAGPEDGDIYMCGISYRRKITDSNLYKWGHRVGCPSDRPMVVSARLVHYKRDWDVIDRGPLKVEDHHTVFSGGKIRLESRPRVVIYGDADISMPYKPDFVGAIPNDSVNEGKSKCTLEDDRIVKCRTRSVSYPKP